MSAGFHHEVSINRFGWAGISRQSQARSETAAWARIRRASGELVASSSECAAERRDPAAGVDQDRQPPLVCDRDQVADRGVVEREPLGARVELDPARAGVERPLGLGDGAVVRVRRGSRDENAAGFGGGGDHEVVRLAVAVGLVHREDRGARIGRAASPASSSSGVCL